MLRIVFLLFALYYSLQAAENTLLNKQLEAINRQLNAERGQGGELDPNDNAAYNYNQNTVFRQEEPRRGERMYVGASSFLGYFMTKSDDEAYNVKESTSITNFRLGYLFSSGNRVELSFNYESSLSYTTFEDRFSGANLNAIIPIPINNERTIYLKFQGGMGVYEYSKYSLEGISLNPAVGLIVDVSPDVELDVSYLYQFIYWKDFGHLSNSSEIKSTSLRGLNIGLKYKF